MTTPLSLYVLGSAISEPGTLAGDSLIPLELLTRWTVWGAVRETIAILKGRRETCARYRLSGGVAYQFCPDTPGAWPFAGHLRAALRARRLASRLGPGRLKGWRHSYDRARFTLRGIASSRVWQVYGSVNFDDIASTPEQQPFYCGCKADSRLAPVGSRRSRFEREPRDAARARGLGDSIELLGFRGGPEEHKVYRASRGLLHPSVYDNYGMAAYEAMAGGVPAVLHGVPPLRVAYPKGCPLAPRNGRQGFAKTVVRLLEDRTARERPSDGAVAWTRVQDWDRKASKVLDFVTAPEATVAASDQGG